MSDADANRVALNTAVSGESVGLRPVPGHGKKILTLAVEVTGTITGVLSLEVANGGSARIPYSKDGFSIPAINGAAKFGLELKGHGWDNTYVVFVKTGGTGNVRVDSNAE
jgi:hypothetical protein